jgi:hypothetical protein
MFDGGFEFKINKEFDAKNTREGMNFSLRYARAF